MSQMLVPRRYSSYNDCYSPPSLYQNLIQTQTYLEKLQAEQPRVVSHFRAWRDHRKSTIDTVGSLQKRIDDVCVGCNVVKGVGAAVGIAGLLAGIIGEVLDYNEHESASQFKEASKYCAGAGAAALLTSTLLEMGLSQSAINEIKRVLKKDNELTEPLRNWIQFSHEIDCRFNQLFQCDIASDTFYSVMNVFWKCMKILDSGNRSVQNIIRNLQFGKVEGIEDLSMEIADKVIHFLKEMIRNKEILQPLKEIWEIVNENPYTLELAKIGAGIYFKVSGHLQSRYIQTILTTVGISLPALGSSVLQRCALDAIMLASHVVTFILSVKNIQKGKSKYSEALDRVKYTLRSELNEVDKQMSTRVQFLKVDWEDSLEELYNSKLAIH